MMVRLEYWRRVDLEWSVGHAGIEMRDPQTYVDKLMKHGMIARAVDLDTGEIYYGKGAELL